MAVACLIIDNKLARALAAFNCLSNIAWVFTSSSVMTFLSFSVGVVCFVAISWGVKLIIYEFGSVGRSLVGYPT